MRPGNFISEYLLVSFGIMLSQLDFGCPAAFFQVLVKALSSCLAGVSERSKADVETMIISFCRFLNFMMLLWCVYKGLH